MTMREFLRENRAEIDRAILGAIYRHDGRGGRGVIPDPAPRDSDRERRLWVLNDEGLDRWARRSGVRIGSHPALIATGFGPVCSGRA